MKEPVRRPATPAGVGLMPLLGLAFIVLKLTGYIDWSWLWVLAPFWVPLALGLLAVTIGLTLRFVARNY